MSLDRTAFQKTLNDLLFNKELPLTLNYARSSALVSDDTPPAEMMQTSIGQGKTQITPMHLNMITCAITWRMMKELSLKVSNPANTAV